MVSCGHPTTDFFRIIHPLRGVTQGTRQHVGANYAPIMGIVRTMPTRVMCADCAAVNAQAVRDVFGRKPKLMAWEPKRVRKSPITVRLGAAARGWIKGTELKRGVAMAVPLRKILGILFLNLLRQIGDFIRPF